MSQAKDKSMYKSMMKYGEERQKVLENYLIEITKTDQFFTVCLMDFLQINPFKRTVLIDKSHKEKYLKKDSMLTEEEDRFKTPFFSVFVKNGKIFISNPEILELILAKEKAEICEFHNRLLQEKRLQVEFLSDDATEDEIVHFLSRVVNSKNLWRSFSEWFMLGRQIEDKIFHFYDLWNVGFKAIEMRIVGHEIAFDREGTIHTLYLLSIMKKNPSEKANCESLKRPKNEGTILKKRYNDFFKLDKHVKKFMQAHQMKNVSLPSLPPKFSPFGSKTSPKSRQIYFDIYIRELVRVEGISTIGVTVCIRPLH